MFGQNDDSQGQQPQDFNQPPVQDAPAPPPAGFTPPAPTSTPAPNSDNGAPALPTHDLNIPAELTDDQHTQLPSPGLDDRSLLLDSSLEAPAVPPNNSDAPSNNDLLGMKQQALQQLTPLVQHLDQSPEEKFRTLMMMIQATDDQTKLNEAFETAKQITDDKVRAQALLDVINEINYFTQHHSS
jgi:hypothetical protein